MQGEETGAYLSLRTSAPPVEVRWGHSGLHLVFEVQPSGPQLRPQGLGLLESWRLGPSRVTGKSPAGWGRNRSRRVGKGVPPQS